MPRRFRSRGRSGRPARGMDWDVAQLSTSIPAVGFGSRGTTTSGWVVLPSDVRARFVDPTLMATRAFIVNRLVDTIPAGIANTLFTGVGLIMWSDVDDTPPIGADCPDPILDGDLDWVNRWVSMYTPGAGAGSLANPNFTDNTHLSKAKRRFGQDQGLLCCFSAHTNAGSQPTSDYAVDVRALIKE